jgi:hypothetical protein
MGTADGREHILIRPGVTQSHDKDESPLDWGLPVLRARIRGKVTTDRLIII